MNSKKKAVLERIKRLEEAIAGLKTSRVPVSETGFEKPLTPSCGLGAGRDGRAGRRAREGTRTVQPNPYQSPETESVVEERRGRRLGHGESSSAIGNAIRWTCAAASYPGVIYIFGWPQSGYWIFGVWTAVVAGVRWFAGRMWAACASAVLGAGFGAVITLLLSIANPMSGEDWLRSVAVGAAWGLYPFAVAELLCFGSGHRRAGKCAEE